jgi:hypothetical protein
VSGLQSNKESKRCGTALQAARTLKEGLEHQEKSEPRDELQAQIGGVGD